MDDIRALKVALESYEKIYEVIKEDGKTLRVVNEVVKEQYMERGVCHFLKQRFDHELTPKPGGYICDIPEECETLEEILETFTIRIKWIQEQIDIRSVKIKMKP